MQLALAHVVVGRDRDGVGTGFLDHLRGALCVLDGDATVLADFAGIELAPHREARPDSRPDGAHDFKQDAYAVLERTAVLVGALVEAWRDEGRQQVAMAGMDFDAVRTRALCTHRGGGKLLDYGADVLGRQDPEFDFTDLRAG